jgi:hypothetical protein
MTNVFDFLVQGEQGESPWNNVRKYTQKQLNSNVDIVTFMTLLKLNLISSSPTILAPDTNQLRLVAADAQTRFFQSFLMRSTVVISRDYEQAIVLALCRPDRMDHTTLSKTFD